MCPTVLLHGFTGSPRSWDAVVVDRGQTAADVVALELPGHAPGWLVQSGFTANVDLLAARLREQVSTPVHLVGYSLGARLALALLVRSPALVSRATLIGVHPGLCCDEERRARAAADARWARVLRQQGIEAFVDAWEGLPLFRSQRTLAPHLLARQRQLRLAHDAEQLACSLDQLGLASMPDYRQALCSATIPVQLIVGARDQKFCALARQIAADTSAAELRTIAGCGHNPLLEAPSQLAALLFDERSMRPG